MPSFAATSVMVAGAVWFLVEMHRDGMTGVAERVVTAMQSLWPFVVVLSCLRHRAGRRAEPVTRPDDTRNRAPD